ncbi:MAG: spore coat protein GerQ [Candidatus Coprovivens sp.]
MNGSYYPNPTFPTNDYVTDMESTTLEDMPMQQSFIENILRHNKGKKVKAYVSFPDAKEWKDKIFEGTIEQAGRDHLIIKDSNGKWYLILMIYLDYVEFDEKIDYTEKKYFSNNN